MSEYHSIDKEEPMGLTGLSTGESLATVKRVINEFLNRIMIQKGYDQEVSITRFAEIWSALSLVASELEFEDWRNYGFQV